MTRRTRAAPRTAVPRGRRGTGRRSLRCSARAPLKPSFARPARRDCPGFPRRLQGRPGTRRGCDRTGEWAGPKTRSRSSGRRADRRGAAGKSSRKRNEGIRRRGANRLDKRWGRSKGMNKGPSSHHAHGCCLTDVRCRMTARVVAAYTIGAGGGGGGFFTHTQPRLPCCGERRTHNHRSTSTVLGLGDLPLVHERTMTPSTPYHTHTHTFPPHTHGPPLLHFALLFPGYCFVYGFGSKIRSGRAQRRPFCIPACQHDAEPT